MHHNNWNEGVGGLGKRVELVEHPSEEKFFEHCTNCTILPRPLSCAHRTQPLSSFILQPERGYNSFGSYCNISAYTQHY